MKKNDQELLGSGQWYFVNITISDKEKDRIIIDEKEYQTLVD